MLSVFRHKITIILTLNSHYYIPPEWFFYRYLLKCWLIIVSLKCHSLVYFFLLPLLSFLPTPTPNLSSLLLTLKFMWAENEQTKKQNYFLTGLRKLKNYDKNKTKEKNKQTKKKTQPIGKITQLDRVLRAPFMSQKAAGATETIRCIVEQWRVWGSYPGSCLVRLPTAGLCEKTQ